MNSQDQGIGTKRSTLILKLAQLKEFFTGKNNSLVEGISFDQFTEKLFQRAPLSFIESNTPENLENISQQGFAFLQSVINKKGELNIKPITSRPGFLIGLIDKPFIVSTIIETIRTNGASVKALLHPIFLVNGIQYSISFIELEDLTQQSTIIEKIYDSITQLQIITSDFQVMTEEVRSVRDHVSNNTFITKFSKSDNQEVPQFLDWLLDGSFIFLGVSSYTIINGKIGSILNSHGILKNFTNSLGILLKNEIDEDITSFLTLEEPIWLTKFRECSPILRSIRMSHLQIAQCDNKGNISSVVSIVGLFSSKASTQEGSSIPLIRRKLETLLTEENLIQGSHDYKYASDTIDHMPKEEAIRLNRAGLRDIIDQTIDVSTQADPKVSVRFDTSKRGASVLVVSPKFRYSEEVRSDIERCLRQFFNTTDSEIESYIDSSAYDVIRLYFHITFTFCPTQEFSLDSLNQKIKALSENFETRLISLLKVENLSFSPSVYASSFPLSYRSIYSAEVAKLDILIFEKLITHGSTSVRLGELDQSSARIDIFSLNRKLPLSEFLPVLEHAGFTVEYDDSFRIELSSEKHFYIHRVRVSTKNLSSINPEYVSFALQPALEEIFQGKSENDILTSLALTAGLSNRQILLIRGLTSFLWQTGYFSRKHQIREAIASHPEAAKNLWKYFEVKFDPSFLGDRSKVSIKYLEAYEDIIRLEQDLQKDRVLRSIIKVAKAILRTNYYQNSAEIAFKLDCSQIEFLPLPKPWREIFVHGFEVEGVHLRTGPVSRGGLRWSERPDDFRTEVLGLVKTQKVKNVFIVPEGAKGGFIVRNIPSEPNLLNDKVRECYSRFIRALISIADNRIGEKVVSPKNVVRWDDDDSYFVVAADKGTATFSDTANAIAINEVGFWLDDAFASGGSNGYDHKILGITAKGGWECVLRHFNDIGIDYLSESFTAVGIGDLAGDVFGNGMILSNNLKLIAAFNHKHIFIDPTPDPKISFVERNRLFNLGRSQWTDYNKDTISTGGGIFERAAKNIPLNPKINQALGIPDNITQLSGEELIQAILKAPVDLLWNGGIGTYIKASFETHAQVNDSGNDRVRISSNELRCKIIGEGGNLGLTQRARVEFSSLGGRCNSDAIDNSGGVGLSDHEVNIKILFAGLMSSGKITRENRNVILKEMAQEVCEQVLTHNRSHAYRLTMSSERSTIQHDFFKGFLSFMEKHGYLNRILDGLPQDDEIFRRLTIKQGLFRPELAVCLAASKMWVKRSLIESSLLQAKSLETYIISYFPIKLQTTFPDEIRKHPLKNTIIATQVTNYLIDIFGISFFYRLMQTGNLNIEHVLKSSLLTMIILDAPKIVSELQTLDTPKSAKLYLSERRDFEHRLRGMATWFAFNINENQTLDELINSYKDRIWGSLNTLSSSQDSQVTGGYDGLSNDTLTVLTRLSIVTQHLELLSLSQSNNISIQDSILLLRSVKDALGITGREHLKDSIIPANKWEYTLKKNAMTDIDKAMTGIIRAALTKGINSPSKLYELIIASPGSKLLAQSVNELTNLTPSVAHLAVIAKHFRDFVLQI